MSRFVSRSLLISLAMFLPLSLGLENEDKYANMSRLDLITELERMKVQFHEANEKLITLLQQTCFLDKATPEMKAKLKIIKSLDPKKILDETDEKILKDVSQYCTDDLAIDLVR